MSQDGSPDEAAAWQRPPKQQRAERRRRATSHITTEQLFSLARDRVLNLGKGKGKGKGRSREPPAADPSEGSDEAAGAHKGRQRWNRSDVQPGAAPWRGTSRPPASSSWWDRPLDDLVAFNEGETARLEKRLATNKYATPFVWWCSRCRKGHRTQTVRFCVACDAPNPEPLVPATPPTNGQRSVSMRQVEFALPGEPADNYTKASGLLNSLFANPANKSFQAAFAPAIKPADTTPPGTKTIPLADAVVAGPIGAAPGTPKINTTPDQPPLAITIEAEPPAANKEAIAAIQSQLDSQSALAPEHRNVLVTRALKKQLLELKKPVITPPGPKAPTSGTDRLTALINTQAAAQAAVDALPEQQELHASQMLASQDRYDQRMVKHQEELVALEKTHSDWKKTHEHHLQLVQESFAERNATAQKRLTDANESLAIFKTSLPKGFLTTNITPDQTTIQEALAGLSKVEQLSIIMSFTNSDAFTTSIQKHAPDCPGISQHLQTAAKSMALEAHEEAIEAFQPGSIEMAPSLTTEGAAAQPTAEEITLPASEVHAAEPVQASHYIGTPAETEPPTLQDEAGHQSGSDMDTEEAIQAAAAASKAAKLAATDAEAKLKEKEKTAKTTGKNLSAPTAKPAAKPRNGILKAT